MRVTQDRRNTRRADTLFFTRDDIEYMHAVNPRYRYTFSSNAETIWPTDTRGRHLVGARRVLHDPPELLVLAHQLILESRPHGGRFSFDFHDGQRSGVLIANDTHDVLAMLLHVEVEVYS